MEIINILIGFFLLVFGANILVEGIIKIAKRLKISTIIISMTIISIGTSIPELVISCIASLDKNQIALSNNIGSNISTIAISLGISSLFFPVFIKKSIKNEVLIMICVQLFLLFSFLIGNGLGTIDGIIFIIIFLGYMIHIIKKNKSIVSLKDEKDLVEQDLKYINKVQKVIPNSLITVILFIVFGLIFILVGGNYVVTSAEIMSKHFGLSEAFIASTIIALGTTLPELSTAIVAARKKEYDIITGNIIGSGVSNIFLIVGIAVLIHPIHFTYMLIFQIGFMLIFGFLMYYFTIKEEMKKSYSIILLLLYVIFVLSSLYLSELLQIKNLI